MPYFSPVGRTICRFSLKSCRRLIIGEMWPAITRDLSSPSDPVSNLPKQFPKAIFLTLNHLEMPIETSPRIKAVKNALAINPVSPGKAKVRCPTR